MHRVRRASVRRSAAAGLAALAVLTLVALRPAAQAPSTEGAVRWARIPAGRFEMGCTVGDADCSAVETPRHTVTITKALSVMVTPVTIAQYRASGRTLPEQPAWNTDGDRPVVNVTWDEAVAFCGAVSGRLPTEAEWEYAARGGHNDWRYPWGNEVSREQANYAETGGRDRWANTSPVGAFPANGYGLSDMSGNVWQWVADWYAISYYGHSPASDPAGPPVSELPPPGAKPATPAKPAAQRSPNPGDKESGEGSSRDVRVMRGGSWTDEPTKLRVSARSRNDPTHRHDRIGFRCVRNDAS